MATASFNPTQDLWISSLSQEQDVPTGAQAQLLLHNYEENFGSYTRRVLLQFDFSTIAKGSSVSIAILLLKAVIPGYSNLVAGQFNCWKLVNATSWDEGATWNSPDGSSDPWPGNFESAGPPSGARNDYDKDAGSLPASPQSSQIHWAGAKLAGWIEDAINGNDGILSLYIFGREVHSVYPITMASKEHAAIDAPSIDITFVPPTRVLTITETPDAGGSIVVTAPLSHINGTAIVTGIPIYLQDDEVASIAVTDADGYAFDAWTGADSGDVGGVGPYTITMDANKAITANWDTTTFKLTLNEGANGTDTLTPNGEVPLHTYDELEEFLLQLAPDAGFQVDELTEDSGDSVNLLVPLGSSATDYNHVSSTQTLTQATEWTSVYKALHTLTTNIVGGAHGTVTNGHAALAWTQEPDFAHRFVHVIQIVPDVGYVAQISMSAGTLVPVEGTQLGESGLFDATTYHWTTPDANATLTVTWVAIAAGQADLGPWQKPWMDQPWRMI